MLLWHVSDPLSIQFISVYEPSACIHTPADTLVHHIMMRKLRYCRLTQRAIAGSTLEAAGTDVAVHT